jgi:hypothetical protein
MRNALEVSVEGFSGERASEGRESGNGHGIFDF